MDLWVKAVRAKDVNGVMSNYAPDILLFDLAPLQNQEGKISKSPTNGST